MQKKIFNEHANRFSPKRKRMFRADLITYLEQLGYTVVVDKKWLGTNIYFGNFNAEYGLTAHYDTATNMRVLYPAMRLFGARYGQFVILLPFFVLMKFPIPFLIVSSIFLIVVFIGLLIPNKYNYNDNSSGVLTILEHAKANAGQDNVFYALTDNEEKGLFGAKMLRTYLKKNSYTKKIINIDCVGIGDYFLLCSVKDSSYFQSTYQQLQTSFEIKPMVSKLLASDHVLFGKDGVMITAVCDSKYLNDVYIKNLHSNLDRELDQLNIKTTLQMIDTIIN